eukprot:763372-Hanusia_phi.AAC.1
MRGVAQRQGSGHEQGCIGEQGERSMRKDDKDKHQPAEGVKAAARGEDAARVRKKRKKMKRTGTG